MHLHRVKYKDIEQLPNLQIKKDFKKDFQGSSPSIFIGKLWSKGKFGIGTIASMRYGLVNSRAKWNVKEVHKQNRLLDICKEVGMASNSVELEVNLKEQPKLNLQPEKEIIPFGPQGEVRKARVTANPTVDSRVERIVSDTDLKAVEGVLSLYRKGFEENFLTKLLSSGSMGLEANRKLVPTRWSITAVDDTIGKKLITTVKDFPTGEFQVYFGGEWGNYYLILFFPEVWSFELFEMYLEHKLNPWSKAGNFYSTDYEDYSGRKNYAEECAGGYYACRLGVLDKLNELKRQGSVLVFRFITPEYNVPLGVWVCREATRKSMNEKPLTFGSQELMLKYAKEFIKNKFGFELEQLLKESKLLKEKKVQRRLSEF
ncbi:hypothetical protein HZC30_00960 [Candidatus Woesearchaeota archaeon]|nr:hypothetical protein [Candidatus Woesearchaeota archaeon]